jgi:DNA-binding transcriptional ArsR family regulator
MKPYSSWYDERRRREQRTRQELRSLFRDIAADFEVVDSLHPQAAAITEACERIQRQAGGFDPIAWIEHHYTAIPPCHYDGLQPSAEQAMLCHYAVVIAIHDNGLPECERFGPADGWPDQVYHLIYLPTPESRIERQIRRIRRAWERVKLDLSASVKSPAPVLPKAPPKTTIQLEDDALAILCTLADSPSRLKQSDLTIIGETRLHRKTVSRHLKVLMELGFIDYNPMAKKGAGITPKGRDYLDTRS